MTRIAGVASAFPRHYYRQQEVARVWEKAVLSGSKSQVGFRAVFGL
jgi:hypothetical protein